MQKKKHAPSLMGSSSHSESATCSERTIMVVSFFTQVEFHMRETFAWLSNIPRSGTSITTHNPRLTATLLQLTFIKPMIEESVFASNIR